MTTSLVGHAAQENFSNPHLLISVHVDANGNTDAPHAEGGFFLGATLVSAIDQFIEFLTSADLAGHTLFFDAFEDTSVDYSFSPAPVFIDLEAPTQNGGFADGDTLVNIFEIIGTGFNDIIRGSDNFPLGLGTNGFLTSGVVNDPGENVLKGGGGDDLLEGRGGADLLDGGPGLDTASYESSPAGVYV